MTGFAVGAVLLVVAALAFLLPPLLRRRAQSQVSRRAVNTQIYRDQLVELETDLKAGTIAQENYDRARSELEARLLEDVEGQEPAAAPVAGGRTSGLVMLALVPLLAIGVYAVTGDPRAIDLQQAVSKDGGHPMDAQQIEAMLKRLEDRLKSNPGDVDGWIMLARSYGFMGRYKEASVAYGKAVAAAPDDAQLLADYADVLAMAQGRRLEGEPEKLVARALTIEPNNMKALALAGTAAFERKDYRAAVGYWEKLRALAPPDSETVRAISSSIEEAQSLGNLPKTKSAPAKAVAEKGSGASAGGISGTVRVSPELAARVTPADTVFIFARPAEGSRTPLAVLRKKGSDLPVQFALDDSMGMAGAKISEQKQVVIVARVTKSGGPAAQPGDLEGMSKPVAPNARNVVVDIAREVK